VRLPCNRRPRPRGHNLRTCAGSKGPQEYHGTVSSQYPILISIRAVLGLLVYYASGWIGKRVLCGKRTKTTTRRLQTKLCAAWNRLTDRVRRNTCRANVNVYTLEANHTVMRASARRVTARQATRRARALHADAAPPSPRGDLSPPSHCIRGYSGAATLAAACPADLSPAGAARHAPHSRAGPDNRAVALPIPSKLIQFSDRAL
jgi:hypothetical protein